MSQNRKNTRKQIMVDDASLNLLMVIIAAIALLLVVSAIYFIVFGVSAPSPEHNIGGENTQVSENFDYPFRTEISVTAPEFAENSVALMAKTDTSDGLYSEFAALVDVTEGKIIASKKSSALIYPASMTKVMTLIVVYENLKSEDSLNDKITITQELHDKKISEQLSGDLYATGDVLTVEDMIYALMLRSDGIAALSLADYIAGSEKAFVELMNQKADELGLTNTNFTNCTGIHHKDHVTTCQEMAVIMMYAMKNPFCANVMSTLSYRTVTDVYADGITFYHSLLVTKFEHETPYVNLKTVDVTAGKTGWTGKESGRCLVSYAKGNNGHEYILVTAKAPNKNEEVLDLEYIYNNYAK